MCFCLRFISINSRVAAALAVDTETGGHRRICAGVDFNVSISAADANASHIMTFKYRFYLANIYVMSHQAVYLAARIWQE